GESCVGGACVANDPCAGVSCAAGESCVDGACVVDPAGADPCTGVSCNPGESCVDGTCVVDDPAAVGQALFVQWGCIGCHGDSAQGTGAAPNIQNKPANKVFNKLQGNGHPISIDGATMQDAEMIAAWLATL
ncbi:MAG: c-type cytochrome, partial [Phycisphaerae bacterium]